MKKTLLTVFMSSSVMLLTACGSGDGDSVFTSSNNESANNIQNPVVSVTAYTQDGMSLVAADSQLMTYKMLGVNGKEVQATSLVFTPKTAAPANGWPIVVWAHGTTGVADKCAPSQQGLKESQMLLTKLLLAGYVVVAPDYEGLGAEGNHPFLNLKSEAFSITDAVVATRDYLSRQGKKAAPQWMTVGHSQGGHAALGAAQYASRAQLDYKGTIAIAPASNLSAILLGGEAFAVGKPAAVQSYIYSPLDAFTLLIVDGMQGHKTSVDYSTVFKGNLATLIPTIKGECFDEIKDKIQVDMSDFSIANGNSLENYGRTQTGFMALPQIDTFLNKTSQPLSAKVSTPVIIYQGGSDQTVPKAATDTLVASARLNGTVIEDKNYRIGPWDHTGAYTLNINNIVTDVKLMMPTPTPMP